MFYLLNYIMVYLLIGAVFGVINIFIYQGKGRNPVRGFLLGLFLGIIGTIICLIVPKVEDEEEKIMKQLMFEKRLNSAREAMDGESK